jgi:hypothetical protein
MTVLSSLADVIRDRRRLMSELIEDKNVSRYDIERITIDALVLWSSAKGI